MSKEPHKQNLVKSDPVARYQQYSANWNKQKAPGERAHNSLRWNVREHMLYHDQVVQKVRHLELFFVGVSLYARLNVNFFRPLARECKSRASV